VPEPVYVVFNPHSGRGRGAALVEPVLAALRRDGDGAMVEHGLTQKAGDEAVLAREAVRRGFRTIVAVGGDGTWSNTAQALIGADTEVRLGLVPGGTGCDFARTLGIPQKDVAACAAILRAGHTRLVDVGRVEDRYFLNIVGFGYDVAVLEDSWTVPWLAGSALYTYCAVKQLGRFPGFEVALRDGDGGATQAPARRLLMLIVANARVFGGGFRIAPQAELEDGLLDAVAIGDAPFFGRLALMRQLMRGTHGANPSVSVARGPSFQLAFAAPPAYETDGEWQRAASAELTVAAVPRALRVLAPPGS
jgi:diacylglycerol kinase (ATP)